MSDIGLRPEGSTLVLWKGRDFAWNFELVDENKQPVDFPDGQMYFELQTGGEHNALQRVTVTGANGGTYKLGFGGQWTAPIDYNDVVENPQNLSGDITDALNGIPALNGNVNVQPSSLYPTWELDLSLKAGHVLTEQLVNTVNATINGFFATFEDLLGVDIDFTIHDNLNLILKITSTKSFDEVGLITFATDVTSTMIVNLFNSVSSLIGVFNVLHLDFYWTHTYQVMFINELGNDVQPALAVDDADLDGVNGYEDVSVTIVKPGKHPLTFWYFEIEDSLAHIKIESEETDKIADRCLWQLVFLPDGEPAGGEGIDAGRVSRVG
ncbi:phage tail protein [Mycobacteroides chelonae]|uniref:phage tail protein n=1 Tax=Mycobacteroides chelonae TaxID=1774 RepID=UPI0008A88041|nr:phage tail protein [Mycobacteroides chelonae]OHT98261.1 phage tail protein [Mycobacteroides chelonae]